MMFLYFLQKYEMGWDYFFSESKKYHVFHPHQILEELRLEFKIYDQKNPLMCANAYKLS
jgi:hypothetical protein